MSISPLKEEPSLFLREFNQYLNEIEEQLGEEELRLVNPYDLRKIALYLDGLRPISKMRKHKENLLAYLQQVKRLKESNQVDETRLSLSKIGTLEPVLAYLNGSHQFHTGNLAVHSEAIIGIVIDVVLSLIGIAKYYYYIPVFTLWFLFQGVRKHKRLEKEGKILNL